MKKLLSFFTFVFLLLSFSLSLPSISFAEEWNIYTRCNDVASLVQDGEYLWWTGYTGIVKYNRLDGSQRIYTMNDYGTGYGFLATAIERNGTKWFGDGKEVLRLDSTGWTLYSNCAGKVITIDNKGSVWFGTANGAKSFDGSNWKQYKKAEGFTDNEVLSAVSDPNGNLWFGTAKEGLFRFDGEKWTLYTASAEGLPSNTINSLLCDETGIIWIGTNKGLAAIENDSWKTLPPLGDDEHPLEKNVTALASDRKGGIWVGTEANLVYLHNNEKTIYTAANSTLSGDPYKRVHALLVDTDGILWVANGKPNGPNTPHLGLARFDGNAWTRVKIPEPVSNTTSAAVMDVDNVKWFITGNSLTSTLDGIAWKQYSETDGLADILVNSISIDDTGRKWFCTGKGISIFDGKSWLSYTTKNGFPGTKALKGSVDRNGIGWFFLDNGLFSFDGNTWTAWNDSIITYGDLTGDGAVTINCIMVDRNNVKWFGTYNDGVLSFDGVSWKHYTKEDGLSGNSIQTIVADRDNLVWIGTGIMGNDAGISCFDGKAWTSIQYDRQMMDGNVTGIAVDKNNVKWFVTSVNVCSIHSYDGNTWKEYSPPWGIGLGGYNCIAVDNDGVVWLGSKAMGIISFRVSNGNPSAIASKDELPKAIAILGISPNPFNPSTTISFSLPSASKMNLAVYDITGRKVRTLMSNHLSAGNHSAVWDGRDNAGRTVSSGVYIARLEAGKAVKSMKMLLMR